MQIEWNEQKSSSAYFLSHMEHHSVQLNFHANPNVIFLIQANWQMGSTAWHGMLNNFYI